MCTEKRYYQVLTAQEGCPECVRWTEEEKEANQIVKEYNELWPHNEYYVEEGTVYIAEKCRNCGSPDCDEQSDHYGISTGYWCSECYEHHYPYRKDAYFDEEYAGESLFGDDDY
jgi:hypothetical protein